MSLRVLSKLIPQAYSTWISIQTIIYNFQSIDGIFFADQMNLKIIKDNQQSVLMRILQFLLCISLEKMLIHLSFNCSLRLDLETDFTKSRNRYVKSYCLRLLSSGLSKFASWLISGIFVPFFILIENFLPLCLSLFAVMLLLSRISYHLSITA